MSIFSYPLKDAANLVACSYKPDENQKFKSLIKKELKGDARAYLLKNDFLVIPGSDSLADYLKFNFRIFSFGRKQLRLNDKTAKGASGTIWHQGFLKHAQIIDQWLNGKRPKMIIGHSLGAASTQILSMSYKVSGIAFAAPRTQILKGNPINSNYCLSICRVDDPVCDLPFGFTHMGQTRYVKSKSGSGFMRHKMWYYDEVLKKPTQPIQSRWK